MAAAAGALLDARASVPPPPWDDANLRPAILALVALHDIGKFSRPFQAKAPEHWPAALGPLHKLPDPGHDSLGFVLLDTLETGATDALLSGWNSEYRREVLRSVCGHHGRPPAESVDLPDRSVCRVCRDAARAFIGDLLDLLRPAPLPRPRRGGDPAFGWWLAGFTTLADWIGSAQGWFGYEPPTLSLEAYWRDIALPRARHAVARAGVIPARAQPCVTLAMLLGGEVEETPVQALCGSLDMAGPGPLLALIEDQTGSGKTEAALLLAHRLMAAGRADGLFVALPTMATANAMYDRLAAAYRRLFAADASPSLVLAHGGRALHDGFQDSILRDAARAGEGGGDAAGATASAQCAAWLADDRRRCFLADVGVGTIDQALFAVLPVRHAPLRLHGLHRRVLLIDEAHAYDAYMGEELARLVAFQAGLGGSTIVLSATLPQVVRRKLAAAYGGGAPAPVLVDTAYPLVSVLRRDGAVQIACPGRPGLARSVAVDRIASLDEAARRVAQAAGTGQAVAWVRNAVDDAIEARAALAALGVEATLFHARFAMGDRLAIEHDVLERFDKKGTERSGVVVATQVIEQSLDLDFDLMVTDLAPMDLLIQRAGRVWRHARHGRPADQPRLLVLSPDPVDEPGADWLGSALRRTGFVYEDHALLWRTARLLFATGAIAAPGDVRRLVEAAYDEQAPMPAGLQRKANDAAGKAGAAISLARQNLLEFRRGYCRNAGAWDSDIRTPTRLGEARTTFRLARWDGATLLPWLPADTPARAWALSEVQLGPWIADGVPPAEGALARAEAAARVEWGRWEQEIPILALEPDGTAWRGTMQKGDRPVGVLYCPCNGLRTG